MENLVTGLGKTKGDANILLLRLPVGTYLVMMNYTTVKEEETWFRILCWPIF